MLFSFRDFSFPEHASIVQTVVMRNQQRLWNERDLKFVCNFLEAEVADGFCFFCVKIKSFPV